jgi:hypothetical protein
LLAFQGPAKSEDPDPEPPKPGPVSAKLVAKKKTYKLDLGGMTPAKFRETVKAGGANLPQAPAVDLEVVITNNTKSDIRVRTTGAVPRMAVSVTGPNVVEARVVEPAAKGKTRVSYTVLRPGQSLTIPITRLSSLQVGRQTVRHYWTEPGEYTLTATFTTSVQLNFQPGVAVAGRLQAMTLKSRSVTVKVEK